MPEPKAPPSRTPPLHSREPLSFNTDLPALPAPASFIDAAREQGIEFDAPDLVRLGRYLAILLGANETVNLTAVSDPDQAWTRHILDSLTLMAPLSELPEGASIIDVGSGGGLPGIPLAIGMNHLRFTLLEATGKKAQFLSAVIEALGLTNARVLNERAEVVGQDHRAHREMYDAVVARAVGPMSVIAELTVPLAKEGGSVFLVKGQKAEEELLAAKAALHMLHAVHAGTIDTPTGRIVVLDKPRKTPRAYPRAPGEPKRKPLGAGVE
ncbi:MAG: 16S rRNA (guanine(527)-N(7))-methyltransferase RsmG [Phycisphaerales bacterium]